MSNNKNTIYIFDKWSNFLWELITNSRLLDEYAYKTQLLVDFRGILLDTQAYMLKNKDFSKAETNFWIKELNRHKKWLNELKKKEGK